MPFVLNFMASLWIIYTQSEEHTKWANENLDGIAVPTILLAGIDFEALNIISSKVPFIKVFQVPTVRYPKHHILVKLIWTFN